MITYILVALISGCIGVIVASIRNYMGMKKLLEKNDSDWKNILEQQRQEMMDFTNKIQKARIEEMNNYHIGLANKQEEIDNLFALVIGCGDEDYFQKF